MHVAEKLRKSYAEDVNEYAVVAKICKTSIWNLYTLQDMKEQIAR